MRSCPSLQLLTTPLHGHPFVAGSGRPAGSRSIVFAGPCRRVNRGVLSPTPSPSSSFPPPRALRKSVPLAASVAILLWCHPGTSFDSQGHSAIPCEEASILCLLFCTVGGWSPVCSSVTVDAGLLSGFSGLESIPGPELPQFDFLKQWSEENQKKYAELDSRFKSSPVLKELLEKSKLNKARNQRELQDKYCIRGAEWGVGDCSTQGMTQEERDAFIAELKKRSGE